LNVAKYAKKPSVSKALFEYILYHENSVREAMDLAAQVRGLRTRQQNI
jgi:tetratricopeptide repeat protein 8